MTYCNNCNNILTFGNIQKDGDCLPILVLRFQSVRTPIDARGQTTVIERLLTNARRRLFVPTHQDSQVLPTRDQLLSQSLISVLTATTSSLSLNFGQQHAPLPSLRDVGLLPTHEHEHLSHIRLPSLRDVR
jgi:hypothetical protein